MGIAAGAVRVLLAAWPYAALHWPCKRIAVVAGLACGGFYTVLTGSQVPMVRSLLMAGFVTLAILAGRRAISMRSLAMAAALLVLIEPDCADRRVDADELCRRDGAAGRPRGVRPAGSPRCTAVAAGPDGRRPGCSGW